MTAPVFCGGSHEMKSLFVVSDLKIAGRGAPGQRTTPTAFPNAMSGVLEQTKDVGALSNAH